MKRSLISTVVPDSNGKRQCINADQFIERNRLEANDKTVDDDLDKEEEVLEGLANRPDLYTSPCHVRTSYNNGSVDECADYFNLFRPHYNTHTKDDREIKDNVWHWYPTHSIITSMSFQSQWCHVRFPFMSRLRNVVIYTPSSSSLMQDPYLRNRFDHDGKIYYQKTHFIVPPANQLPQHGSQHSKLFVIYFEQRVGLLDESNNNPNTPKEVSVQYKMRFVCMTNNLKHNNTETSHNHYWTHDFYIKKSACVGRTDKSMSTKVDTDIERHAYLAANRDSNSVRLYEYLWALLGLNDAKSPKRNELKSFLNDVGGNALYRYDMDIVTNAGVYFRFVPSVPRSKNDKDNIYNCNDLKFDDYGYRRIQKDIGHHLLLCDEYEKNNADDKDTICTGDNEHLVYVNSSIQFPLVSGKQADKFSKKGDDYYRKLPFSIDASQLDLRSVIANKMRGMSIAQMEVILCYEQLATWGKALSVKHKRELEKKEKEKENDRNIRIDLTCDSDDEQCAPIKPIKVEEDGCAVQIHNRIRFPWPSVQDVNRLYYGGATAATNVVHHSWEAGKQRLVHRNLVMFHMCRYLNTLRFASHSKLFMSLYHQQAKENKKSSCSDNVTVDIEHRNNPWKINYYGITSANMSRGALGHAGHEDGVSFRSWEFGIVCFPFPGFVPSDLDIDQNLEDCKRSSKLHSDRRVSVDFRPVENITNGNVERKNWYVANKKRRIEVRFPVPFLLSSSSTNPVVNGYATTNGVQESDQPWI